MTLYVPGGMKKGEGLRRRVGRKEAGQEEGGGVGESEGGEGAER